MARLTDVTDLTTATDLVTAVRMPEGFGPVDRPALPVRPATIDPEWAAARRVLAVRLDNLGDLLMTTPALAAIRRGLPHARLTLLASRSGAAALRHLPMLDDAIAYAAPWTRQPGATDVAEDHQLVTRLASEKFDAAVIFGVCTQSALPAALLCRLAGIPLRLAYCRENPYDLLTHWQPDTERVEPGMRHEVRRQLDLVGSVGFHGGEERLVFDHGPDDVRGLRERIVQAGARPDAPCIVLHVGATASSRRYPVERFAAAADRIAEATGWQVFFTGDASEVALVARARAAMTGPSTSLAGLLDLGQLGALLAGARLLVSNNTGPVHMAAALGTPVVVLYAQTNPQHTPWMTPSRVLFEDVSCRNCLKSVCPQGHHHCLEGVETERVVRAALELIGDRDVGGDRGMPGSATACRAGLPETTAILGVPA